MFRRFIKPSKSSLNLSSSALKCFVISTPLFLRYSDAEGRFIIPLSSNSVLKVMFTSLLAIKRNQKNLTEEIKDSLIINKIFEIKEKNINFFNVKNGVIAIKNVISKTADYKINEKTIKDINFSLSKSFFNDYSRYYIQLLANKHKLKRNYKDLENFIGNIKSN